MDHCRERARAGKAWDKRTNAAWLLDRMPGDVDPADYLATLSDDQLRDVWVAAVLDTAIEAGVPIPGLAELDRICKLVRTRLCPGSVDRRDAEQAGSELP